MHLAVELGSTSRPAAPASLVVAALGVAHASFEAAASGAVHASLVASVVAPGPVVVPALAAVPEDVTVAKLVRRSMAAAASLHWR